MRSKQYFTSIKNNPHEISTDPVYMPFSEAIKKDKPPDKSLIKVLDELCI